MGSDDLVVGEDQMVGPSSQTGRRDSIAFGNSPRRVKTLIQNPRCLTEVSPRVKDIRR